ncbi:MAG: superoxide dismutase, Ni [Acidobacteria bacterium]|nr:superoxide dismutase, Ni [Acidobacteriota bacterium]MBU4405882.1 superoxide dismutase, Ni [Acidobacteriota bacterium]
MMIFFVLLAVGGGPLLRAHCQVPCGIYDDEARFKLLAEHVTTMEKAMKEIAALSVQAPVNYNQIMRWVMNKEKHAEEFSEILSYYFLAQRIKPAVAEDKEIHDRYLSQLELVHLLLVNAMKAKQGIDLVHINKLNELLVRFQQLYFGKK